MKELSHVSWHRFEPLLLGLFGVHVDHAQSRNTLQTVFNAAWKNGDGACVSSQPSLKFIQRLQVVELGGLPLLLRLLAERVGPAEGPVVEGGRGGVAGGTHFLAASSPPPLHSMPLAVASALPASPRAGVVGALAGVELGRLALDCLATLARGDDALKVRI
jgi:hypothetical protein